MSPLDLDKAKRFVLKMSRFRQDNAFVSCYHSFMVERRQIDPGLVPPPPNAHLLREVWQRIEETRRFEGEVFSHPLASDSVIDIQSRITNQRINRQVSMAEERERGRRRRSTLPQLASDDIV